MNQTVLSFIKERLMVKHILIDDDIIKHIYSFLEKYTRSIS